MIVRVLKAQSRMRTGHSAYSGRTPRGFTLLEAMVTVLVLSIAITATLQTFITHIRASRYAEERRAAYQSASAKMDQFRVLVSNGVSLDGLFQLYGPLDYSATGVSVPDVDPVTGQVYTTGSGGGGGTLIPPTPTGAPLATFAVGEDANNNGTLDPGEDLNANGVMDVYLTALPGRPLGTVTFITDEAPQESNFGNLYNQPISAGSTKWYERNPFGVDLNGNHTYGDAIPPPFPLDINGDGDTTDTAVTDGFLFLPTEITIQWAGPYGPERIDLFSIISQEQY